MGAFSFLIQLWLQVYCSQKPKKSIQAMHWTGLRLLRRRHCMFTGPWRCKRGPASCRNQQEIISAPKCNLHLQKPLLPQISVSFRTEHAYTHTHTAHLLQLCKAGTDASLSSASASQTFYCWQKRNVYARRLWEHSTLTGPFSHALFSVTNKSRHGQLICVL